MGLFDKLKATAKEVAKQALDSVATMSSNNSFQSAETATAERPVVKEVVPIEYSQVVDVELNRVADGEYEVAKFVGFEEESMEIPAEINGQRIVGIADEVFFQLGTLTNLKISEGIRYIGSKTFSECPDLEVVELPESLEKIGAYCFSETKILNIKIPSSVVEIGEGAFYECKELQSAVLPEQLEEIPANMFCRCEILEEITFPINLSVVGANAFNNAGLILESLPETITTIGDNGFAGCFQDEDGGYDAVEEFRLPSGLKTIGAKGLAGLNCLTLIIPASVTFIGENAFEYLGCVDGEVDVIFEEGCSAVLSDGIFFNGSLATDSTISSITIPSQITEIGNIFYGKDNKITTYDIKDEYGRQVYDERGNRMYEHKWVEVTYDAPPENLTIYCDPGSAAMKFAREKGINCAKREN